MDALFSALPEGGPLVALVVVVVVFLRSIDKIQERYVASLNKISEEHKAAVKDLLDRITLKKAG